MEKQKIFNFEEKTPEVFKKKRIVLSPTTLSIFQECPRCFWLHINLEIKRPRVFPTIALGLDQVIKEDFQDYRKKGLFPPFLKDKIEGKLMPELPKELFFNDNSKNAVLKGMLDECLILPHDVYAALDYKTRSSFPKDIHPSYQLQMDMYTLLLEKNNYKTKGLAYLLYFIPDSAKLDEGIIFFKMQMKEVKTSPQRALDVFHKGIDLLHTPLPPPLEGCGYCDWIKRINEWEMRK